MTARSFLPNSQALALMREALALLDRDGPSVAACQLSLAIETALKGSDAAPPWKMSARK